MTKIESVVRDLETHLSWLIQSREKLEAEIGQVQTALDALRPVIGVVPQANAESADSASELLSAIIRENPSKQWAAAEMAQEMHGRGWETVANDPVNVIRTMLSKLEERGVVARVGRGIYQEAKAAERARIQQPSAYLASIIGTGHVGNERRSILRQIVGPHDEEGS